MKLLIFTPIWKRPEIVKEYLRSIERLPEHTLFVVLSPEDPDWKEIFGILPNRTKYISCENKPFGRKKNKGLEGAKQLEWDYMMELNSDSIVNPKIFDLYAPYMEKKTPFFGLSNLYVTEYNTKKSLYIPKYNDDMTFGAGRMLHRSALIDQMWTDELDSGMDTNMIKRLRAAGIKETVIDNKEPMIVDLKTHTTIWHFKFLEKRAEKEVEYDWLVEKIGYNFINEASENS